jgi:CheY-like chemotaxis protein
MLNKLPLVLIVEDNEADVCLVTEAFKRSKVEKQLHVVRNGVQAMEFLRRRGAFAAVGRPDLVLMDLNLPGKRGREVLEEMKGDPELRRIPVIIFTTSNADIDIIASYDLHANCYIVKPADLAEYFEVIRSAESFWLQHVTRSPK